MIEFIDSTDLEKIKFNTKKITSDMFTKDQLFKSVVKLVEENHNLRKQVEIAVSVLTLVDSSNEAWLPHQAREAVKSIQKFESER